MRLRHLDGAIRAADTGQHQMPFVPKASILSKATLLAPVASKMRSNGPYFSAAWESGSLWVLS